MKNKCSARHGGNQDLSLFGGSQMIAWICSIMCATIHPFFSFLEHSLDDSQCVQGDNFYLQEARIEWRTDMCINICDFYGSSKEKMINCLDLGK